MSGQLSYIIVYLVQVKLKLNDVVTSMVIVGPKQNIVRFKDSLAEMFRQEMVLFRTRNGSIPCFIYGTPKWFYIEPFIFFGKRFYWPSTEPRGTLFLRVYRTF